MFKRSVNFSPYEKDQLLQLIREYIVIFEDKRLDGVGRREKERAWLELTDRYNSLENVNLRTSKQLQACWKNLKNRARDITEACKKGADFPFFTIANKFHSSYLPSTEEDDTYDIQVKAERFSEPEDGERDELGTPFLSLSHSISSSPTTSAPDDSPPTVTNYVYSPTASLPPVLLPPTSSVPSISSTSSNPVLTPPSKPFQERQSDVPSPRVDSIAARLSYSMPSYRTPERSISKSVDRIASSILFERGVSDDVQNQNLFEGRVTSPPAKEKNGLSVADHQHVREGPWEKSSQKSENASSAHFKSVHKPYNVPGQNGPRNSSSLSRSGTPVKPVTSSARAMVGVNGHVPSRPSSRVSKAARYRRLEHQTRMRNLKFERECFETEHKLRCELLQMKIKFFKQKTEEKSSSNITQYVLD